MAILFFFIMLVFNVIVAPKFASIAEEKGYTGYFWWCFFLGIVGWMMVIALPDRGEKGLNETQLKELAEQLTKNSVSNGNASNASSSDVNGILPNL